MGGYTGTTGFRVSIIQAPLRVLLVVPARHICFSMLRGQNGIQTFLLRAYLSRRKAQSASRRVTAVRGVSTTLG